MGGVVYNTVNIYLHLRYRIQRRRPAHFFNLLENKYSLTK